VEAVVPKLLVYGPLGIINVVLLYAVIALYRAKEAQSKACEIAKEELRKEYQEEARKLVALHKQEQDALMERHISKAETWVEKGNELANNLHKVLEALSKRKGGSSP
jgi:hypothetical protein